MTIIPNKRRAQGMSEAAKDARAAYAREWRRKNPEKQRAIANRYWEKKATLAAGSAAPGGSQEENSIAENE